jgi:hypothetical protein
LAKNRYGWQKRAKELARKQKHDDKLKRRQSKANAPEAEEMPETSEQALTDAVETVLVESDPQPSSSSQD